MPGIWWKHTGNDQKGFLFLILPPGQNVDKNNKMPNYYVEVFFPIA